MTKIRILIADDHRVVREGLAAILKSRNDMDVVGEAINGFEVIEKTKALKPDVILMDISMPQMNGVEATRAVRKISPEIGIVVLTMHDDDATIFELVRTGVHGYLLKDADSSEIVKAIQSIYNRDYPVVQCVVFISATLFVAINFAIDMIYGLLDPRVRPR